MIRVRSRIHACHEGNGYRDGFGSWVVFWDRGYVSYPSESEVIVIG
jgi:hypothetical protein